MHDWKKLVRERLGDDGFRGEMAADIQEELAAHLEDVWSEALAGGMSEEDAIARALAEVDDWEQLADRIVRTRRRAATAASTEALDAMERSLRRRGRLAGTLADGFQELRFAFRRFGRSPGFTVVVLLSLGIGIGATMAIYSVVKGVLLDPLPFADSERLVAVWNAAPGAGEAQLPQSLSVNAIYEDESQSFEEVGVWSPSVNSVMGRDGPEEVSGVRVTQGVFRALRVQPVHGRGFRFEDTQPGSPLTVILSHRYWVDRMAADPEAIGSPLDVSGTVREIIGVMPEGFRLMDRDADLYFPIRYDKSSLTVTSFTFRSIGRLREGVTIEQAHAELRRLLPLAPERYPGGMTLDMLREIEGTPLLRPLKAELVGNVGSILWVVLAGVGIILLVACANVANLILVQAEGRERALAVRAALGSSRRRLVIHFLTESMALGMMGGLVGALLASGGVRLLRSLGPGNLPRLNEIGLDSGVLVVTFVASISTGLLLAILPLFRFGRIDLSGALKEGGRGWTGGPGNGARNTLAVAQLAMAVVLLVGSGLMIRTFNALLAVEPGYAEPEHLLTFRATATSTLVPDGEDVAAAHEALANRLAEVPGVEAVGLSSSIPMDGAAGFDPVFFEDFPIDEGQIPPTRSFKWIGEGYHEALGNPIVAGRSITWTDIHNRARVVVITEHLAREVWGDPAAAIGRRLSTGFGPGDWREIIGVVGDVRDLGLDQDPVDIVYWPMVLEGFWSEVRGDALFVMRTMTYVVRSPRVGTPGFLGEVRNAVWASFPGRPLGSLRTMADLQSNSLARTSFALVMLGIAAAMALLLGTIGIYGVIAYIVGQRTREMGLRIAMGANPGNVRRMVLGQGLLLAGIGIVLGLGGAVGATRLMEAILFGVSPVDPLTYLLVAAGITGTVLLAVWIPAWKASKVDPMVALRAE